MRIILPLAFLFLFLTNNLHAQDFEPGYIVNLDKDTIRGFVQEQTDNDLVYEIDFKSSSDGEVREYSPGL